MFRSRIQAIFDDRNIAVPGTEILEGEGEVALRSRSTNIRVLGGLMDWRHCSARAVLCIRPKHSFVMSIPVTLKHFCWVILQLHRQEFSKPWIAGFNL